MKKSAVIVSLIALSIAISGVGADTKEIRLTPSFAVSSYFGGRTFLTPQAVSVDNESGDVYMADTNNGRIVVFTSHGRFVTAFNHRPGSDKAAEPVGVAVDRSGLVYVTDSSSHAIHTYDLRGRPVGKIAPGEPYRDALFGRMTVDSGNNLYVVVRNKGWIFVYDPDRSLKLIVGSSRDQEKLEMACDVAVDGRGRIYALSSLGTPVHVYDPNGARLFQFGMHSGGREHVAFPTSIDIDGQGRIWITDSFAHRIKVYTDSGTHVTDIGGFFYPVDLALWSKESRLFVLEKSAQRLSGYVIQ